MSLTVKTAMANRAPGKGMPGVGDPGLFGTIGSLFKGAAKVASNIPGPIGWGASAVNKFVGGSSTNASGSVTRMPAFPQAPASGMLAAAQRFVPGGETGMEAIGSPAGYHVNKSDYFLKDGTFIPAGSRWVKNRRRNPLNPRAASRAVGRIESLKKATARFSNITIKKKCCKK